MAGHEDPSDIPKLTGIKKYFNSYTLQGRANVTLGVYAAILLGFIYTKFKKPKTAQ